MEEGTTTVPFPATAQPEDDRGGGAIDANYRPREVFFTVQKKEKLGKETQRKRER